MNQDYDPAEYMKKLRSHKVYRNGRLQLWATLQNRFPHIGWVLPFVGFVVGFVIYKLLA